MGRSGRVGGIDRRRLIQGSAVLGGLGALGLGGCTTAAARGPGPLLRARTAGDSIRLAPIRASVDRIFDITVCLRPFRAAGPRLDTEQVGDTLVVHNYGHGGSGWSLSWGSSTIAVQKAMAGSPREVAVLGCGVLGLTSAILAQTAGAQVTIYAKELLPDTRSSRATGSWTPDSRIAAADKVAPGFPALWEQMARTSFKTYRRYLGLPGTPVEWIDYYDLSDDDPRPAPQAAPGVTTSGRERVQFASYEDRISDLTPKAEAMPKGSTPFATDHVWRGETMIFNIAAYGHTLLNDFRLAGGRIEHREFHEPGELARLKEKVVINCSGYGARALWKDESIVPVRGQIAWLIPQPEARYGFYYNGVNVLSRRDGIVIQTGGGGMRGYGEDNETPDRADAERAVKTVAGLYSRMRPAY
ncbi:MAG: dependent oxidoreductase [Caulobacteraceae bacterium]|nr:dependent oxidoreductase [Caulobacteraceae bacterium]